MPNIIVEAVTVTLTAATASALTCADTSGLYMGQRGWAVKSDNTGNVEVVVVSVISSTQFLCQTVTNIKNSGGADLSLYNGGKFYFDKQVVGGSKGTVGVTRKVTNVAAATYDLATNDDILDVTYTSTGAVTNLRLMTAQMIAGRTVVVKDGGRNAGTNNITITTEGAEKIDGADTLVISTNGGSKTITVNSDGTGWMTI